MLKLTNSLLSTFGFNLKKFFYSITSLHLFFFNLLKYIKKGGKINGILPILGQHKETSGKIDKHYFFQDYLVSSYIYSAKPKKHIDVGSRLDGFVSSVAVYRNIEVIDIRNNDTNLKNIRFHKGDINNIDSSFYNSTDSLSCLHTVEHIGLARYGDSPDPKGHIKAFKNLLKILKPNGLLYLSFPISSEDKVYFNAHRVFHPLSIFQWSSNISIKNLIRFDWIDDAGKLHLNSKLKINFSKIKYGCGIYTLKKIRTF